MENINDLLSEDVMYHPDVPLLDDNAIVPVLDELDDCNKIEEVQNIKKINKFSYELENAPTSNNFKNLIISY